MKIATRVWLATAQLQCDNPERPIRTMEVRCAVARAWPETHEGSVSAHLSSHCIASLRPSPDTDRMLTRVGRGQVRLFREGDPVHPGRAGGRILPDENDVPDDLRYLLAWYTRHYAPSRAATEALTHRPPDQHVVASLGSTGSATRERRSRSGPNQEPGSLSVYERGLALQRWGREIGAWDGVDPDEFVRKLREDWD